MITVELVERNEPREEYLRRQKRREDVSKLWEMSKGCYSPKTTAKYTVASPSFSFTKERIKRGRDYSNVPYGPKTLEKSGCAIFCIEHALRVQGKEVDIAQLAKEAWEKGYLHIENGTYHCIFDKYKNGFAKRALIWEDVEIALKHEKIVTMLVKNSVYHNDPNRDGNHFINLSGIFDDHFVVQDSQAANVLIMPAKRIFDASLIAWIWD